MFRPHRLFGRAVTVLPMLLAAPKLFEPHSDVGLGELQMLRTVFFDVFYALNAFSTHWPKINEFRATCRRLHEFECAQAASAPADARAAHFERPPAGPMAMQPLLV